MRYAIVIFGLISLLAVIGGLKASQISTLIDAGEQAQKAGPPPEVVSSARAEQQTWESTLKAVGSAVAGQRVALSNDEPGVVSGLFFESGARVRRGQLLMTLDAQVERAQLASVRARARNAELSLARSRSLVRSGALPPSELDAQDSSFASLRADANALEARLARRVVRAPFDGRLGIREVNLGQYLPPGTTITSLEAAESVFVDFTLPQQLLANLQLGLRVRVSPPGAAPPAEGEIHAIDSVVDPETRSVKVRASVPNPQERLRSGMFVNVEVVLPEKRSVLAVPSTAVVRATYGDSVFVIEPRSAPSGGRPARVARQQFVRLGETRGDFTTVLEGLKAGQEVVTEGAFKLRNGAPVTVNNDIVLQTGLHPVPENR